MAILNPIIPHSLPSQRILSGFTTRQGGVSSAPFDSLNLSLSTTDDPRAVRENYILLYRHLGIDGTNTALMRQRHSSSVIKVSESGIYDSVDGMVTDIPGLLLGVRVADCVPVLLYDPDSHAAGVVHCGWRPVVSGILENTLRLMKREWNTEPAKVIFALGPSAGSCCYEIGAEVAVRMRNSSILNRDGRLYADLHAEIMSCLGEAGVGKANIESIRHCTICTPSLYYSHRRDRELSGRMMGYIMLKE